jgi:hypothetical protein
MDRRELLALLAGAGLTGLACRPDRRNATVEAARPGQPYQFKALDPHQAATVSMVGDCIIPTTDTPGASEAGVPEFIDVIVGEWYEPAEREQFLAGLADLDRRSAASGGRFIELDAAQQLAVLTQVETESLAAKKADPKAPATFWVRLKSLTLYGYYTSAAGTLQELDRPIIPGRFDGCEHLPAARPGAL